MQAHITQSPIQNHSNAHLYTLKTPIVKLTECTPCTSDLTSFEIDYDDISEPIESFMDTSQHRKGLTAKGNEISPVKMPLMRIRSVEIVFEDEISTCTDSELIDRNIELIISDSSDNSTKCVDSEHVLAEKDYMYDSVTLNADDDLSDDSSVSLTKDEELPKIATTQLSLPDERGVHVKLETTTNLSDVINLSPNTSEVIDSGRFTEDASSSHMETVPLSYDDALLSNSFDTKQVDKPSTSVTAYESCSKLYEYVDSNSDSSENTVTADIEKSNQQLPILSFTISDDDQTLCDSLDLQYDSFVDMGKF